MLHLQRPIYNDMESFRYSFRGSQVFHLRIYLYFEQSCGIRPKKSTSSQKATGLNIQE